MFDRGFGPEVRALLQPLRSKESPAACILVLATLKKVTACRLGLNIEWLRGKVHKLGHPNLRCADFDVSCWLRSLQYLP